MSIITTNRHVIAVMVAVVLAACGGDDNGVVTVVTEQQPVLESKIIVGTVAIGAALGNVSVEIVDSSSSSPCIESAIITDASGNYQCTLRTPLPKLPYFIRATDVTGTTTDLFSVITTNESTPVTTVNVTQLTTAIIAQAHELSASVIFFDPSRFSQKNLDIVKINVVKQISQVTNAIGLRNFDPFSSPIVAATANQKGNMADLILDLIRITKDGNDRLVFHSLGNPEAIQIASTTETGTQVLAPTIDNFDGLSVFLNNTAKKFNLCAALPSDQRVMRNAEGVFQSLNNACLAMVSVADSNSGIPEFKEMGQTVDWFFWEWLGDRVNKDVWTKGVVMAPSIMIFCRANTNCSRTKNFDIQYPRDRAWISINIKDVNGGNPLTFMTVAQNYGAPNQSNWQITGNQSDFDHRIQASLKREEDWNPDYEKIKYKVGVTARINKTSPNSNNFDAVKVEGPGFPTTGLWYFKVSNSSNFVIANERIGNPTVGTSGTTALQILGVQKEFTPVCSGCLSYTMVRADSPLSGGSPVITRPGDAQANRLQYALGGAEGSYNGDDQSRRPIAGDFYRFSAYKAGTIVYTDYQPLTSDVLNPLLAHKVLWMTPGSNILAALDPTNTTLNPATSISSLDINWSSPMIAKITITEVEPIKNVWVSQTNGGFENSAKLKIGEMKITAMPLSGQEFTSLGLNQLREIGIEHRMMDGSVKASSYNFERY